MLPGQCVAPAGDRCPVKFMVLGVMVVDKARLLHHDIIRSGSRSK